MRAQRWLIGAVYAGSVSILAMLQNDVPSEAGRLASLPAINGCLLLHDAGIMTILVYYALRLGVLFLAFSMVADEITGTGRYLFTRTTRRAAWLCQQYAWLTGYVVYYWLFTTVVYGFGWLIRQPELRPDLVALPTALLLCCLNAMFFLILANALSLRIDPRLALLLTVGVYLAADAVLAAASSRPAWLLLLPTVWGRQAILTAYRGGAALGAILNLVASAACILWSSRRLQETDIF